MAASVVLTGISIAAALAPLVKPLILGVERIFGKGTGPAKLQAVVDALTKLAEALGKAGIVNEPADASKITALVQALVDELKQPGGPLSSSPLAPATQPEAAQPASNNSAIGLILQGLGQLLTK